MHFLRRSLIEQCAQKIGDVVLDDQFFLIESFKQLVAQSIDGLALLVHHVVVFEQMLAGFEVLRFDGLLRSLDALGDHARFNRHALFHAEALQQRSNPLLGEDAHQVVFKREIETRCARIALASGASAKLVIDTPRLMPLSAEDVQATCGDDRFMLLRCISSA